MTKKATPPLGIEVSIGRAHETSRVIIGGIDVTAHVRDIAIRAGIGDATRVEIEFVNVTVNQPAAPLLDDIAKSRAITLKEPA